MYYTVTLRTLKKRRDTIFPNLTYQSIWKGKINDKHKSHEVHSIFLLWWYLGTWVTLKWPWQTIRYLYDISYSYKNKHTVENRYSRQSLTVARHRTSLLCTVLDNCSFQWLSKSFDSYPHTAVHLKAVKENDSSKFLTHLESNLLVDNVQPHLDTMKFSHCI